MIKIDTWWDKKSSNEKTFIGYTLAAILLAIIVLLCLVGELPPNGLILYVSELFFDYFIILLGVFLYRLLRKKLIRKKIFYIIWLSFFALSLPHMPVLCGYSTNQIGSFYEANEYTEKYIVLMSREPLGVKRRKQYTLPAEIERRLDYMGSDDDGYEFYDLNYHIRQIYFPNGGYLSFNYDDEDAEDSLLEVDKERKVVDYHGDSYYVTLTKEKVE